MRRNYYWCKTIRGAWIVKCYTEEEVDRYYRKLSLYTDMKLIG